MFASIKNNLLWSQGRAIIIGCCIAALVCLFLFPLLVYGVAAFFIFSLYFFRYPKRVCTQALSNKNVLICPADGKVVDIQYDPACSFEGYAQKVSIFLSPFDVHVNWVPYDGIVEKMVYKPGAFMCAFLPKSSELNERNDSTFKRETDMKETIMVRQIAGIIARRICWWVSAGQQVQVGDTFGMIRFGSRVDIFLPAQVTITLDKGQRVYGGHTILGEWQ